MEEKHQRGDSKATRNKDGWGLERMKRIGNYDDFEKFCQFFSKYTNGDVAPLRAITCSNSAC